MSRLIKIGGNNADVIHPREDALALVACADVVIIREPDFEQDAHAVTRMEEGDAVKGLILGQLLGEIAICCRPAARKWATSSGTLVECRQM